LRHGLDQQDVLPELLELQELVDEEDLDGQEDHTKLDQTPEFHSTEVVPSNLLTITDKTHTQLPMLGAMDPSSLTPEQVSVSGGLSHSQDNTGLTESESRTEEIAAEEDLPEPRSLLTTNCADQFKMEPETELGTKSNAQDQCGVKQSSLSPYKMFH